MRLLAFIFLAVVPSALAGGSHSSGPRIIAPTGPFKVGYKDFYVTDTSRNDLFNPTSKRRLAFTIFYPTLDHVNPQPYFLPPLSTDFESFYGLPPTLSTIKSNSKKNAFPLPLPHGLLKRVLFSHGGGSSRLANVAILEDLASHGYIAITVDHPYDARLVAFPDGTVINRVIPDPFTIELVDNWYLQRISDLKYVDDLTSDLKILYNYHGPSRPRVPASVSGMSFGGAAAAGLIINHPTLYKGGFNLDGAYWNNSIAGNTANPALLIGPPTRIPEGDLSWESFKAAQTEWVGELHINGTEHHGYTDAAAWAGPLNWPSATTLEQVGTLNGDRLVTILRAHIRSFLDMILRGGSGSLVKTPSPFFPEVEHI